MILGDNSVHAWQMLVVLVQKVILINFSSVKQLHLTWWAYLLDRPGHIEAQHVCILKSRVGLDSLNKGSTNSISFPSLISMPDMNCSNNNNVILWKLRLDMFSICREFYWERNMLEYAK